MSAPPLTHHEIVALVEPFTRRGRHVDLAGSDRLARRLVFKPVLHGGADPLGGELRDVLELQCLDTGTFVLSRRLIPTQGPAALLQAAAAPPAELLEAVLAVDPQGQFGHGPGHVLALSARLQGAAGRHPLWTLTQGVAQLHGLTMTLSVPSTRGVSADISLRPEPAGETLALPQDVLAVLGWNWARLVPDASGWTTKLRLYGQAQRRSRAARHALERAAAHLARTLQGTPGQFHDRHRYARIGVVVRRAIPLLTVAALTAAVLALPRASLERTPGLWVLMFHVPVVLIALSFCLQDLARLEIPPWPWRDPSPSWRQGGRAAAPTAARARAAGPGWADAAPSSGPGAPGE
jgi:hypothetical protein